MRDISELFWQVPLEDIKQGFTYQQDSDEFICLICGECFANGVIYPNDGQLYEARRFVEVHIKQAHNSPFHFLLSLDKKLTGLTDHQKNILQLFYDGYSDKDIAQKLDMGSTSTIRNHRFSLREKQKQARIFLAIMELLSEQTPPRETFIPIPRTVQNVDERFAITEQERDKVLAAYFNQGLDGPLRAFPPKEKKRVIILGHLIKSFSPDKTYSEQEVNGILRGLYEDYVLLRRYFIEYGFMDRTPDGSSYWVNV